MGREGEEYRASLEIEVKAKQMLLKVWKKSKILGFQSYKPLRTNVLN